jgi:hypothetical protein
VSLLDGVNVWVSGPQGLAAHVEARRARQRHRAHMVIDISKELAGKGQTALPPKSGDRQRNPAHSVCANRTKARS